MVDPAFGSIFLALLLRFLGFSASILKYAICTVEKNTLGWL